ncbi:hypothetical protein RF11_05120 [Thelohanellus kitauei]|uniref:Uncharacterized protein n=1 Tax=Thelohanellus kitauei TaxID=669202 RepID=A0A0C2MC91_THEKT|nr:hypothetical protein RF11_05120 [Thelohanellus kitauei]
MDHILNRIRHRSINPQVFAFKTKFVELLESLFELCKYLPNFLVPCYFEASNREIINLLVNFAFSRMNQKLLDYDHFVRKLCLSTFAFGWWASKLQTTQSSTQSDSTTTSVR